MEPYINTKDVSIDDLPMTLSYHLYLLEVFAGCTVGRYNITTIEAKVQSIFDYIDIIHAILDPRNILLAKIQMGLYLLNAIIEVEMKIPGLEQAAYVWKLLETFPPIFASAKDDLRIIEKYGWDHPNVCIFIAPSYLKPDLTNKP